MTTCKLCNGQLRVIGRLGSLLWKRCQSCGMEFSKIVLKSQPKPADKIIGGNKP